VGDVAYDEDQVLQVYPIVSGTVEKVFVRLGDYVRKGTKLATIVSTDINEYQNNFILAKNELNVAEKNLKRIQELYRSNFASAKELNEAQRDFDNARQNFDTKKKLLELYGGSETNINDAIFHIISPVNGYIVEKNIIEGTQIRTDNSSQIFKISDLKKVWVWANVHESDISKIKEGYEAEVTTLSYPDKMFKGVINKIGATLEPSSRVVKVRIDLNNPDELLKPEMFANIVLRSPSEGKMLYLPTSSVFIENSRNYVIRKTSNDEYCKVPVQIGKVTGGFTEILQGLSGGETIVGKGSLFIASAINNK
jgi:cobalt-zinc-cadmium efflux system membrane fusion protein